MLMEIREGGDGVACWNAEAITTYVSAINAREAALSEDNPDLRVTPGRVKCYGCEVMEYDMGTRCTAELTKTLYAVEGEVGPRRADASASLSEIPGLLTRIDPDPATTEPAAAEPVEQQPRRGGLFGRFGRRS